MIASITDNKIKAKSIYTFTIAIQLNVKNVNKCVCVSILLGIIMYLFVDNISRKNRTLFSFFNF